jgi:predicted dehydrogenase
MIKWGVIGTGHMANIFAESIQEIDNAKLVAVSSRTKKSLEIFGDRFNIIKNLRFISNEEICASEDINAIYISTLNNTHFDLIKLCAVNKKNILCEKPFCLNLNEAKELKKIIITNKVMFFEAIAYLSHPQTDRIIDLVNNNEIGEITSIESTFGFKVRKIDPESRLFNKKLGGGVILDVGCYPMSFISLFLKNRNRIFFNKVEGEICHTNVDIAASANITINDKIECKITISLKEYFKNNSIIKGTKGNMVIGFPWLPEKKVFFEVYNKSRYYKNFVHSELSVYANQIKNVSNEFLKNNNDNKSRLSDISKSLANMTQLDHWMQNIE